MKSYLLPSIPERQGVTEPDFESAPEGKKGLIPEIEEPDLRPEIVGPTAGGNWPSESVPLDGTHGG